MINVSIPINTRKKQAGGKNQLEISLRFIKMPKWELRTHATCVNKRIKRSFFSFSRSTNITVGLIGNQESGDWWRFRTLFAYNNSRCRTL